LHKHPHHNLDVWNHTLYAVSLSKKDFTIRLALLLHDIGKPYCYTEDNGIRHFHNHAFYSYLLTKTILTRLCFKDDYINEVCYLVRYHDTPINEKDILNNYELEEKRYEIQRCDTLAHNPKYNEKRENYLKLTKKLFK